MFVQKRKNPTILWVIAMAAGLIIYSGCDAMDSFLTSAGTYKINIKIGDMPLNECSFITSSDEILPFFEESVVNDPDITSLVIQLKNDENYISGWKIVYSKKTETEQYNDPGTAVFKTENMDEIENSFKLPDDLSAGLYSIIFEIMGGKNVLQRTERDFYYLSDTFFSFEGIDIHLPGVADNTQITSKGQVIMLEAKVDFDESLDPYIVWYSGRVRITEGKYSDGANLLLWRTPDQSNFYPLRAEIYPANYTEDFAGYKKDISILVSSYSVDVNLVSENIPELRYWYVLDGNLNDLINQSSSENALIMPSANNRANWMPSGGTYGLATGPGNYFSMPRIPFTVRDSWQLLFRFKPAGDGSIFRVNFNSSSDVVLDISIIEEKIILSLMSPFNRVTRSYSLPQNTENFLTMGINIAAAPRQILAKINVLGNTAETEDINQELKQSPIIIESPGTNSFQVILGALLKTQDEANPQGLNQPGFNAIWDEFALYNNPSMEHIAQEIKSTPVNLTSLYE